MFKRKHCPVGVEMRINIDLTQFFAAGQPVWKATCKPLKIKTMARTKREALVLLAKRLVRISNEELDMVKL